MTGARTLATDYDVYEIAYLAGGPRRVVETAVAVLVESGRIRAMEPTGELAVVDPRRGHPVEAAVLDAVGVRGHRSIDAVHRRVESDDRLAAVARRLAGDGLLRPGAGSGRRGRWLWALTREGRRTLRHLRGNPPDGQAGPSPSAVLVALTGPDGLADPALRAAVFEPPPLPGAPRPRVGFTRRYDPRVTGHDPGVTYGAIGFAGFGGDGGGCGGGDGGGGC
jgi:hypothetical protein